MTNQTNLNYEELRTREIYLLGITDEQLEHARRSHLQDPSRWASPEEIMNRIDHDLFEGEYRK